MRVTTTRETRMPGTSRASQRFESEFRREVSGEAPFVVLLGNGHGVELLYNDAEIDITSRVRGDNTARVNVGG